MRDESCNVSMFVIEIMEFGKLRFAPVVNYIEFVLCCEERRFLSAFLGIPFGALLAALPRA